MVPSGEKTILNLTLAGVAAVNALPVKNSVSMSLGASRPAGAARRSPLLNRSAAAAPTILAFIGVLQNLQGSRANISVSECLRHEGCEQRGALVKASTAAPGRAACGHPGRCGC